MGARAVVWVVAAGVLGAQLAPWTPDARWLGLAGGLAGGLAWIARRTAGSRALALLAVAAAAAGVAVARLAPVDRPVLPAEHVRRLELPYRGRFEGTVEAIAPGRGRTMLLVAASAVERNGVRRAVSGRVRVSVRGRLGKLRTGDGVRVETTLRVPRNFANPGSFDLVGYLARRGVWVIASVWDGGRLERAPRPTRGASMRLARWRERLGRSIGRNVPAPRAAVLRALVLGDDGTLAPAVRDAFARAGVVHVLSVSGLHIGLVAAGGYGILRWVLGRSERLLLACDVRRVAAIGSLGPVALYGALAGLEAATLRSVLMAGIAVAALLLDRPGAVARLLALAAIVMAFAQPGAPREIGFQLSFVSVAALLAGGGRGAAGWGGRLRNAIRVSGAALLGTAPLTAFHFQQIAPMGLIANPVVIPLFGSLVVALGLASAAVEPWWPGAASEGFRLAGEALRPGLWAVHQLARPSWAAVAVPRPDVWEMLGLYLLLAAAAAPAGRPRRWVIAIAALGLLLDVAHWARVRWRPGVLRVTFLDVGQGDAAVAELPDGRVLVVDAGGFVGSDFDTGAALVGPYLATRKIRRIDALVMTHAHPDHAGGLPALLRRGHVGEFWWSGQAGSGVGWSRLRAALAASGVPARVLRPGEPVAGFPAETVAVLHPPSDWPVMSLNERSLTLKVAVGAAGVLLTGDIEAAAESRLVRDAAAGLRAAILKVPHHGSRTSSGEAFLDAVAPGVAVISVGTDNRYGLPSPEVEARYRARGACLLRTDRCGAITVVSDGRAVRVTTVRAGCACPAVRLRP